ncbi:MAG: nitroreductase family protein [Atopobiaceae bacterium]|nr:nitroreductase family protein [Atopobiaceae bacterium]
MDIMQAIDTRISCRAYDGREVEAEKLDQLEACIAECNAAANVRMALMRPADGGADLRLAKAMFAGQPSTYIAYVSATDEESRDRLGYYGEKVILLATQLGLGTCWVAGTYDRASAHVSLEPGEELYAVVPVGYPAPKTPLKQRTVRAALRKRDKKPTDIYAGYNDASAAVRAAIDAVIKGPSAVNGQPWVFIDTPGGIAATLPSVKSGIELLDLGIAKLHFELGAASAGVGGSWSWGIGGTFTRS